MRLSYIILHNEHFLRGIPQQIGTNHRASYTRIDSDPCELGGWWIACNLPRLCQYLHRETAKATIRVNRRLVQDAILTSRWFAPNVISLTLLCKCYATRVRKQLSIFSRRAWNDHVYLPSCLMTLCDKFYVSFGVCRRRFWRTRSFAAVLDRC